VSDVLLFPCIRSALLAGLASTVVSLADTLSPDLLIVADAALDLISIAMHEPTIPRIEAACRGVIDLEKLATN
jgi:hypothetical protein